MNEPLPVTNALAPQEKVERFECLVARYAALYYNKDADAQMTLSFKTFPASDRLVSIKSFNLDGTWLEKHLRFFGIKPVKTGAEPLELTLYVSQPSFNNGLDLFQTHIEEAEAIKQKGNLTPRDALAYGEEIAADFAQAFKQEYVDRKSFVETEALREEERLKGLQRE